MKNSTENNKRIAQNTLLLYVRMLFLMIVNLYTSRVILNALGIEDFGLYSVVGGVVAMFSIISGSLSAAISRFLTYELGRKAKNELKRVFSASITIQLLISVIILFLAESIGIWFLNTKMIIPPDRLIAANWVLQFSLATFVINLISVPYNAAIIANERMSAFAYVSIIEGGGKLGIAYFVMISPIDRLVCYAVLLCLLAFIVRVIYGYYCNKNFEECKYQFYWDKAILKKMFSFAGWNFIGSSAGILRDQGVNVIINLFCGPTVNAARGIAIQVNSAVQSFGSNFMTALNPQIIKSYASSNREYLLSLLYRGSRLSFYLLFFLSLPILIETESVLSIWLNNVPEHTKNFVRLVLILAMVDSISLPLITALLATGKIKNYSIFAGGLNMLNFPFSYLALYYELPPESTLIIAIVLSLGCFFIRLYMLRHMIEMTFKDFFRKVVLNVIMIGVVSSVFPVCLFIGFSSSIIRFFLIILASVLSTAITIYGIGCTKSERAFIVLKFIQFVNRLK